MTSSPESCCFILCRSRIKASATSWILMVDHRLWSWTIDPDVSADRGLWSQPDLLIHNMSPHTFYHHWQEVLGSSAPSSPSHMMYKHFKHEVTNWFFSCSESCCCVDVFSSISISLCPGRGSSHGTLWALFTDHKVFSGVWLLLS